MFWSIPTTQSSREEERTKEKDDGNDWRDDSTQPQKEKCSWDHWLRKKEQRGRLLKRLHFPFPFSSICSHYFSAACLRITRFAPEHKKIVPHRIASSGWCCEASAEEKKTFLLGARMNEWGNVTLWFHNKYIMYFANISSFLLFSHT